MMTLDSHKKKPPSSSVGTNRWGLLDCPFLDQLLRIIHQLKQSTFPASAAFHADLGNQVKSVDTIGHRHGETAIERRAPIYLNR
jgi:hypothetical protein